MQEDATHSGGAFGLGQQNLQMRQQHRTACQTGLTQTDESNEEGCAKVRCSQCSALDCTDTMCTRNQLAHASAWRCITQTQHP